MGNSIRNTHRWRSLWVFVIALALSGLLHWGWHMLGERRVEIVESKNFEVTVCLPPFCHEPESSGGRHPVRRSISEHLEAAGYEEQSGLPGSMKYDYVRPRPDGHVGFAINDPTHQICVFDLIGASGQQFSLMGEWQRAAVERGGFRPALRAYTNADVALEDFTAEKCDAVFIPGDADGMPLSPLASLSAFGAVTTRDHTKLLTEFLASEIPLVIRDYLVTEEYESLGLVFSGPAYLFVNGPARETDLGSLLEARNLAVSNSMQKRFSLAFGAMPVGKTLESAIARFNSDAADGILIPLRWIPLLDINNRQQVALLDFPLYETTYILISHKKAFSDEQKKWSRKYVAQSLAPMAESDIAAHQQALEKLSSLKVGDRAGKSIHKVLRDYRVAQRDGGYYDGAVLSLIRRIRCRQDHDQEECANPVE